MHFQLAENSAHHLFRRAADNLKPLPIEFLQVSLEHFLEQKQKVPSLKFPNGLHSYLHLEDLLLLCDVRDPYQLGPVSIHTDQCVSVQTHAGIQKVTPELWAEAAHAYRPDVMAAMADTIGEVSMKSKRIVRSVDRTLRWLDDHLAQTKDLEIPVFGQLMGSNQPEERQRSAKETAKRKVQGFILNMTGLEMDLVRASVCSLPEDRPRLAYGLSTPERILAGIKEGIDLFDGSYAYQLTQNHQAMVFQWGQVHHTLNLLDTRFARDTDPLDAQCQCHACRRHTKAYIHHLLNAHEMLGPLLLMSHNLYQLEQFMADIRASMDNGSFQEKQSRFFEIYQENPLLSLAMPVKNKRIIL
ncbi:tRNA-guanine(15) transglycosylase-like protein [Sporodiniella umbellata]|nr:tRNA-guanine(15) transglycosylase-like protein [Sporodiniella umbellata]